MISAVIDSASLDSPAGTAALLVAGGMAGDAEVDRGRPWR